MVHETMHRAANTWACCQLCFLPAQSSLRTSGALLPGAPEGRAGSHAAPRVRFSSGANNSAPVSSTGRDKRTAAALGVACSSDGKTGFKIRIPRPHQQAFQSAQPAAAILPLSRCTLIVTPVSILGQWLQELQRHAPALAARTLVYSGLRELGKRHTTDSLLAGTRPPSISLDLPRPPTISLDPPVAQLRP